MALLCLPIYSFLAHDVVQVLNPAESQLSQNIGNYGSYARVLTNKTRHALRSIVLGTQKMSVQGRGTAISRPFLLLSFQFSCLICLEPS